MPRRTTAVAAPRPRVPWWIAAVLFMVLGSATPAGAAESEVNAVAGEWLTHWLGRRPDVAVALGAGDARRRHGEAARAITAIDTAWIAPLEQRLRALPDQGLSRHEALDRDLLLARLAGDRYELGQERRFERDPGYVLPPLAAAIRGTLEDPARPPAERMLRAAAWLGEVGDILSAVTAGLRQPGSDETRQAARGARDFAAFLREGVPAAVEARAPEALAALAEADSAAVRALLGFAAHLENDVLPLASPSPLPDRDAVMARLAVLRTRSTPESLLARARGEIAAHRTAMERAATAITGAPDVPAALAQLEHDVVPTDSVPELARATFQRLRRGMVERRLLPARLARPLKVERARWSAPLDPLARLSAPGAWEGREHGVLRLAPDREDRRVPRTALVLDVASAGVPGRWSAALARREAPSRLRQALTLADVDGGWAIHAARLAVEDNGGADDPRLALAWRARETRALARAVAQLAIAVGEPLDAVAGELARNGAAGGDAAPEEALWAARDPAALADVLVLWRVLDLRARMASGAHADAVHEAMLRLGLPLSSTETPAVPGKRESRAR